MWMQTPERERLLLYTLTHPGHVVTARGVRVQVRYYTTAYVPFGEFVLRRHFKVLEILPDVVLGLSWLRSYNPTVAWKERYEDVRQDGTSY